MRFKSSLVAAVIVAFAATTAPAVQAATGALFVNEKGEPTLAPVIQEVSPAIVNIATRGMVEDGVENPLFKDPLFGDLLPGQPDGQGQPAQSVGSGVIVDADNGYIITNHHVIAHADEIMVTLTDRRQLPATLIGSDPETDVAVLQVEAVDLVAIDTGDSDLLLVGDFVVAIGNPFGLGQTVTLGIVSAVGRSGLGIEGYEDFIQTDASINPGNSGGALVSLSGDVIGINTAILGNQGNIGIGFAIPINMATSIMDQIIEHGSVQRGLLGINIQDLTPDLAEALGLLIAEGALVSRVFDNSAASEAGVQNGDIVMSVNETPVADASDLRNAVGLMRVGETAMLEIVRDGDMIELEAVIKPRPDAVEMASVEPGKEKQRTDGVEFAGAVIGPIDPASEMAGVIDGVQIIDVTPNSPAWVAGLRPGDVVTEVARTEVTTPDEFAAAIERDADGRVALHVRRGDQAFYILI
ncbi:MAG: serine endoprotease DegQ [Rhodospirillaceae bacterium]|nr:serine endoprotease DegQ [Rhodospirillaceae bacterium]